MKLFILSLFITTSAFALEPGDEAQYLWTRESQIQTQAKAQIGFGLLGSDFNGSKGAAFLDFLSFDFALIPSIQLSFTIPLAGTASLGPDDFGVGNISLGAKYVFPFDRMRFGVGVDLYLPSARNGAVVGNFSRSLVQFQKDQTAISPYLLASYVGEEITLSADFQTDLQIYSTPVSNNDDFENLISYDFAAAHAFYDHLWVTVEFGGWSSTSYSSNSTQLFTGPGIRFQDHEVSVGFHFFLPIKSPSRDIINFMTMFDVRVPF